MAVSPRLAYLDLRFGRVLLRLLSVYAPPSSRPQAEFDEFFLDMETTLMEPVPHSRGFRVRRVILGDLNSKVGPRQGTEVSVGNYGVGNRNARGQTLVDFCDFHRMKIGNTFFKKRPSRKYTWIGPNGAVCNEIDFFIYPQGLRVLDVDVVNRFDFVTDHRLVRAVVSLESNLPPSYHHKPLLFSTAPCSSMHLRERWRCSDLTLHIRRFFRLFALRER